MKPVRLTEQELQNVIQESVKTILNEYGYRIASLAHGANYNAAQSDIQQKDPNAKSKMDSANIKRVPALNQAIEDTIGIVSLTFIETDKKSNQSYSVVLKEGSIKYINREKFIIEGLISISDQSPQKGQIEYNFNTGTFYRVNFYGNGRIRRINPIRVHYTSKDIADKFLTFISNFLYSEEDYENDVNINGPTTSKIH